MRRGRRRWWRGRRRRRGGTQSHLGRPSSDQTPGSWSKAIEACREGGVAFPFATKNGLFDRQSDNRGLLFYFKQTDRQSDVEVGGDCACEDGIVHVRTDCRPFSYK